MLSLWIRTAEQIAHDLIGHTGSSVEFNVLVGVAIVVYLLGLFNISAALGATMATPLRVLTVSVVGGYLSMAAAVATRLYLVPQLHNTPMLPWLPLIMAALVTVVVTAPLARWILSTTFLEAAFALLLSAVVAVLLVMMVRAGMAAVHEGDKDFIKTHNRRDSINRLMDDV